MEQFIIIPDYGIGFLLQINPAREIRRKRSPEESNVNSYH